MKRLWLLLMVPTVGWAQTDVPTSSTVPPAPSAVQQDILNACRADMPHRTGLWQNHGDLACTCMFTGRTAWNPGGDPALSDKKIGFLAKLIRRGGLSLDLRDAALNDGIKNPDIEHLGLLARVYPAVLFQSKAVVQCFNAQCNRTPGCEVEMNDISGTAPRAN